MGRIEDKHKKRRDKDKKNHPLSGSFGETQETNDFDIDEDTIKDQQNKS